MRIRNTYKIFSLLILAVSMTTLTGCGQKGDLFLPDEKQAGLIDNSRAS
jgi:predicted small lipoprotein YifL